MARSRTTRPEQQTFEAALRAMFRSLEMRPVPDSLRDLVDQLDQGSRQEKAA